MIRTITSTYAKRMRKLAHQQSTVKILRDGNGNAIKIIKIRGLTNNPKCDTIQLPKERN